MRTCTSTIEVLALSASSGLSMMDGWDSWKGMLNMCCCAAEANATTPSRMTRTPLSPRFTTSSRPSA